MPTITCPICHEDLVVDEPGGEAYVELVDGTKGHPSCMAPAQPEPVTTPPSAA